MCFPTLKGLGRVPTHPLVVGVVTGTMFSLRGSGRLVVDAIFARDHHVVHGVLIFPMVVYILAILAILVINLLYPVFDAMQGTRALWLTNVTPSSGLPGHRLEEPNAFRRFFPGRPNPMIGTVLMAVFPIISLAGLAWTPNNPVPANFTSRLEPSGATYPPGTDQ